MKRMVLALILFLVTLSTVQASEIKIAKVEIVGEINEGTYLTLQHAYDVAMKEKCDVLFIVLDTPGGVLSSTQRIVQLFLNSNIPVIVYVPKGAMCASAGSIILLSTHIAIMANGTAVGAATPVIIAPSSPAIENKTVNYLASYVYDVARSRGRNAEVAEKFVTQALTLTAREAQEKGIINYLADSESEAIRKLNGTVVDVNGRKIAIEFNSYQIIDTGRPIQASIYNVISSPQLAAILLILGIYLLIFGLTSPGILPETIGAICLVLALAGLGVIGINYLGALLIVLGIIFLIAELSTPTYGVLGAASIVCMVLGLMILFKEPLMPESFYDAFPKFAIGVGVGFGGIMTFMLVKVAQIRRKKTSVGEVVGEVGTVLEFSDGKGFARVRGEIWKIESDDKLEKGDEVEVLERRGLKLKVKKVERGGGTPERDKKVAGENREKS